MPRVSGVYSLPASNPVVTGTTIEASWANTTMQDVAAALTQSIAKDGQTAITANLPMSGFRHTGVGVASARNHYGVTSQIQDGTYTLAGSVAGTNTVSGSLSPVITAYANGMRVRLFPANTNTGATTLALNGLTARAIVKFNSVALVAGDIVDGVPADVVYDLANTQWVLQNPQAGAVPANSITNAMIRQSSAVSVLGRSANSSGNIADIAAGANDRILRRVSNALDFGQLTAGMFPNTVVPDAALSSNVRLGTVAVANGGTGSTSASAARTALGLAIGSDIQAFDADLSAIAALAKTNSNFIVGNGSTWVAESGSTARTSLGLGSLATASTINNGNWSGTDLAVTNGGTGASTAGDARTNLGLGSLATQSSVNNSDWSGTDLAVTHGGTGSSTAAGAIANLGGLPTAGGTMSGDINCADNKVERPEIDDYSITSTTAAVSSNAVTCTYSTAQSYEVDLEAATGTVTITISGGPPAGTFGEMIIKVQQDSTANRELTWAGGTFVWTNGSEKEPQIGSDAITMYYLQTWDGGTTWYINGQDYS